MSMPQPMKTKEAKLADGDADFSLVRWVLARVNDDGVKLSEVAVLLGMTRATLQNWMSACGYSYSTRPCLTVTIAVTAGD